MKIEDLKESVTLNAEEQTRIKGGFGALSLAKIAGELVSGFILGEAYDGTKGAYTEEVDTEEVVANVARGAYSVRQRH